MIVDDSKDNLMSVKHDSSSEPMASIITPTHGREELLPALWTCIQKQTWSNLEWLVEDDSPTPSIFMQSLRDDPRVHYSHCPERRSIGEKRNLLIGRAEGEYIVHFDDDDFYAPRYIADMIVAIRQSGSDFCKLSGFFLYYKPFGTLAYWDLLVKTGIHYKGTEDGLLPIMVSSQNNAELANIHMGFGFSYVYKRSLWESIPFTNRNVHEDQFFITAAAHIGRILLIPDVSGICLHFLHSANTSQCFPQFVLPPFMASSLFAEANLPVSISGEQSAIGARKAGNWSAEGATHTPALVFHEAP